MLHVYITYLYLFHGVALNASHLHDRLYLLTELKTIIPFWIIMWPKRNRRIPHDRFVPTRFLRSALTDLDKRIYAQHIYVVSIKSGLISITFIRNRDHSLYVYYT